MAHPALICGDLRQVLLAVRTAAQANSSIDGDRLAGDAVDILRQGAAVRPLTVVTAGPLLADRQLVHSLGRIRGVSIRITIMELDRNDETLRDLLRGMAIACAGGASGS